MRAKQAIAAAFRGHGSLKHVWVVDEDINPFDPNDVEWAVATRFQADRGLVVLTDQPSSSLDPSAHHAPGQKSRTAKMGIDATVYWDTRPGRRTGGIPARRLGDRPAGELTDVSPPAGWMLPPAHNVPGLTAAANLFEV